MSDTSSGISRRTLAKGAAWAAPAVAVAAAAPAYAKSGRPPTITVYSGCKQPGNSCNDLGFNKGYTFTVSVTNPTGQLMWVYLSATGALEPYFAVTSGMTFDFGSAREYFPGTPDTLGSLVNPLQLTPGETRFIAIDGTGTGNSANTYTQGVLWLAWGHSSSEGGDTDHPYTPSPWAASPPYGEGWTGGSFSIGSPTDKEFPPCDKKNNCIPTSTPTTTTTTLNGLRVASETTTVATETTTVATETTTVATETTTVATENPVG